MKPESISRRSESLIRVEGVSKRYGELIALDDINLSIARGKTTALIGPSGSGKSTLLALLIGLETPDRGVIKIDGSELTPKFVFSLRRRMGYVIQEGGLFPHMTALENISLMAKVGGWSAERSSKRVDELCALTRFPAAALNRYPIELSGGQRQRVSLMRALMLDPDILLMDEPLGALDPMIRTDLQDDLKTIFQSVSKTVILVTHDLSEAAFLSDEIILMNHSRVVQQGSVGDLLERPADPFVAQFVSAQLRRVSTIDNQAKSS